MRLALWSLRGKRTEPRVDWRTQLPGSCPSTNAAEIYALALRSRRVPGDGTLPSEGAECPLGKCDSKSSWGQFSYGPMASVSGVPTGVPEITGETED